MPIENVLFHVNYVLGYILSEPQFKTHFVENCTKNGTESEIFDALNDDAVVHLWKSSYVADLALKGGVEMERIDGDAERYAEMVANLNE